VIAGLDELLETTGKSGLGELRSAIGDLLGGSQAHGRVIGEERLAKSGSVNRVRFEVNGETLSFVVKRSKPAPAQRNALVVRRWLPAVRLGSSAPAIVATAAERGGRSVWHVYEDLGDRTLKVDCDPVALRSAVALLGALHTRFVRHPMLAEAREWGGELGVGFYRSSVRDAITCLEAISRSHLDGLGDYLPLRDRLLDRMSVLRAEERERTEAIADLGGPDTLLHGDLWLKNLMVVRDAERVHVRLIDWDHAGLGPVAYDLSTFIDRFAPEERAGVLELYKEEVVGADWRLPSRSDMNHLFATFELARITNCIAWSALAVTAGRHVDWALKELSDWLESLDSALHVA
jgi:hypothetical protein